MTERPFRPKRLGEVIDAIVRSGHVPIERVEDEIGGLHLSVNTHEAISEYLNNALLEGSIWVKGIKIGKGSGRHKRIDTSYFDIPRAFLFRRDHWPITSRCSNS